MKMIIEQFIIIMGCCIFINILLNQQDFNNHLPLPRPLPLKFRGGYIPIKKLSPGGP